MSDISPNLSQRYYCRVGDVVDGPFDLIELAAQLRYNNINSLTPLSLDGATGWRPFGQWPEFAAAQKIPIEDIAAHLEVKERVHTPEEEAPARSWTPWMILGFLIIAVGTIFGLIFYATKDDLMGHASLLDQVEVALGLTSAPVVPVQEGWPVTHGNYFSIMCPVALEQDKSAQAGGTVSYRGQMDGVAFGIDATHLPDRPDAEYEDALNQMQKNFMARGFRAISKRMVSGKGYKGWEISCSGVTDLKAEICRVRFVMGKGNLLVIWVVATPDKFNSKNMDRYLASLEVR